MSKAVKHTHKHQDTPLVVSKEDDTFRILIGICQWIHEKRLTGYNIPPIALGFNDEELCAIIKLHDGNTVKVTATYQEMLDLPSYRRTCVLTDKIYRAWFDNFSGWQSK